MLFFNWYNLMWTSTCFAFVCFWSKNKCRLSAAAKQKSTQKKLLTSKGFSGWNSKLFLGVKTVVLGRREAKARMEGRSGAGRWKVFSRWRKKMWQCFSHSFIKAAEVVLIGRSRRRRGVLEEVVLCVSEPKSSGLARSRLFGRTAKLQGVSAAAPCFLVVGCGVVALLRNTPRLQVALLLGSGSLM